MSERVPQRCPVCATTIPTGDERCPGCGKVFGEANRCLSCRGIAAVREVAPGEYVCTACGASRRRLRHTAVDSDFADDLSGRATRARWGAYFLWPVSGAATLFGASLLALGAGVASAGWAQTLGYVVGGAFLLFGLPMLALARHLSRRARQLGESALDARLVLAAARHHGTLTADVAAREVAASTGEADRRLTDLAKRGRLGLDVDDEGVVRYRVAEALEEEEERDSDAATLAALRERSPR